MDVRKESGQTDKMKKSNIKVPKNERELDQIIHDLKYKHQTARMNKKEEIEIVRKISEYESLKPEMKRVCESNNLGDKLKQELGEKKTLVNELNVKIKECQDSINHHKGLCDEEHKQREGVMSEHRDKNDKIGEQIRKVKDERNKLSDKKKEYLNLARNVKKDWDQFKKIQKHLAWVRTKIE